eukprot:TRINITY_DN8504_c0_g1_i3.p1 TRINITY_DN8504_c0_g1~~TRINITY_DN8504_c0_g1_i3.p1  ORF type:complete len:466 (+),score=102.45 TRINITY_DN8504_c0_g1_i3:116-1513(+)
MDINVDEMIDMYTRENAFFSEDLAMERANNARKEQRSKVMEVMTKCFTLTGLAKIKGVNEYIKDLIQCNIKFIVYAHHREILDKLEELVKGEEVKYIRIDGNTPQNQRYENVKRFQEDPEVKVGVLSLMAACVGYNLTATSNIVFAEIFWTPAVMIQAEDRAHRIGQDECVTCHYLYGEGTLDPLVYAKIENKHTIISGILDGSKRKGVVTENMDDAPMIENEVFAESERTSVSPMPKKLESKPITSYFMKKGKPGEDDPTQLGAEEKEDSLDLDVLDKVIENCMHTMEEPIVELSPERSQSKSLQPNLSEFVDVLSFKYTPKTPNTPEKEPEPVVYKEVKPVIKPSPRLVQSFIKMNEKKEPPVQQEQRLPLTPEKMQMFNPSQDISSQFSQFMTRNKEHEGVSEKNQVSSAPKRKSDIKSPFGAFKFSNSKKPSAEKRRADDDSISVSAFSVLKRPKMNDSDS